MTTVIIDTQEHKVYTDSCGTRTFNSSDISYYTTFVQKAWSTHSKIVVGAGRLDHLEKMKDAILNNYNLPNVRKDTSINSVVIVLHKSGVIDELRIKKKTFSFFNEIVTETRANVDCPRYMYYGSGRYFAQGAICAGSTPEEAIKAASLADYYTDDKVVCTTYKETGIEK